MVEEIGSIQQAQMRSLLGPSPIQSGETRPGMAPLEGADTDGPSFNEVLKASIDEVNRLQNEASQAQQDLVTGANRDVHSTMIAMQKADVSFKLMMEVRNKIVDAYKEVMRMQV